jgi:group I intron endonuclease
MNLNCSGIYQIKNKKNNKVYIGSAVSLGQRFSVHTHCLRNDKHHNRHLQNAWNKYGEDSFLFEVLEKVEDKEKLVEREQHWIDIREPEYNLSPTAGSTLGVKYSEEARKNVSNALKGKMAGEDNPFYGKKHSKKAREKMSAAWEGRVITDEWRANLSKARKGRFVSEEERRKRHLLMRGENNPIAKLTWEQVAEIREKYLNKEETKATVRSLCEEYGVKVGTMQDVLENKTWVDPSFHREVKRHKRVAKEVVSQIRERYEESNEITFKELAEEFGLSRECVAKIIKNKSHHDPNYTPPNRKRANQ